jgi:tetratricopeptide (TPR) repeat protein
MRFLVPALLLLLTGAALAAPAPKAAPGHKASKPPRIETLFSQLAKAESPEEARPIEQKIARLFRQSSSASVTLLMSRADSALAAEDEKTARKLVNAVTTIAPRYAEGWHVRAGLENQAGDDTAALISLQRAVQLNPRNFTALFELGAMLEDYGDKKGALKLYRRALALDPQLEGAARHVKGLERDVEGQAI